MRLSVKDPRLSWLGWCGLLLVVWAGMAWADGQPVVLILDVSGPTEPALEPFSELPAGSHFKLGPDTIVEFQHYNSCELVKVRGGRLNISTQRFQLRGGQIIDLRGRACPTTVEMNADAGVGGVMLRAGNTGGLLVLSTHPGFVLVGKGRDRYGRVRILADGAALFEGAIESEQFRWPEHAPPLISRQTYRLQLLPVNGAEPLEIEFIAKPRRGRRLTLLRVD